MKFSVNWLRELVELPPGVEELADLLTRAGVEIEGMAQRGADFPGVVVAQIKESAQHPNADRLSVCQVDDGSGTLRQIVCGAKNYQVGDKVPLAQPGANLPGDLKIRASKLRGVESQGMLCSAKELNLAEEAAGLLILSPEASVGAPISSLYPADTILDVEITPNRPDLLSYRGLAREIAALTGKRLAQSGEQTAVPAETDGKVVTISATDECPFFSLRRIEGITVGPSPEWLRLKLEASGLRAINNIVDITNYVMLELGQPLHAFDADKLEGAIRVRLANEGETFLALDGRTYALAPEDLMVTDQARAVGIAGVMGGEETGVTGETRNVLLEAAWFLPAAIRRTARRLNLPSDASYRFERGVDPQGTLRASARAAELMREVAGGRPVERVAVAGAPLPDPVPVRLREARCAELLGVPLERGTIKPILEGLGLHAAEEEKEALVWSIPSYRRDLQREVDLIEEVIRVHGIDRVPGSDRSRFTPVSAADRTFDRENGLRRRLVARGFFEARTSALVSRASLQEEEAVPVRNPLSEDHVALRPSLLRGLLEVLRHNAAMGATTVRLFEVGRIFRPPGAAEERTLGLLLSGAVVSGPHWRGGEKRLLDFYDLRSALEVLGLDDLAWERAGHERFALAAEVKSGGVVLGLAGQLSAAEAAPSRGARAGLPGADQSRGGGQGERKTVCADGSVPGGDAGHCDVCAGGGAARADCCEPARGEGIASGRDRAVRSFRGKAR